MSFQTLCCILTISEVVRRIVWDWTERYTLLVNELLDQVASDVKFAQWQEKGTLPKKVVENLLVKLEDDARFKDLPDRLYTSAFLIVRQTYSSWLALQKRRYLSLRGKQRWLDVLEADLELASITDFDWDAIRTRACEIRDHILNPEIRKSAKPARRKHAKGKTQEEEKKKEEIAQSPLNALFEQYATEEDPLNRRAIAHLIRNNLEVSEQEETLDPLIFRLEKKRIEIERLEKQLESRKPKGRDPLGERFNESSHTATALPKHTTPDQTETELNAWKPQKQIQFFNTLHYPVLFGDGTDLAWSVESNAKSSSSVESEEVQKPAKRRCKKKQKKSLNRICVTFRGFKKFLKQSSDVFRVQCDRRHLPVLRQIESDWQVYKQLPDEEKFGCGLMVLRTAQLIWKKDKQQLHKKAKRKQSSSNGDVLPVQSIEPWKTHRLYLHFTIDTRLLSAQGTEEVRQEKIAQTVKKLDGLKKAKVEQLRKDSEFEEISEDSVKRQKNLESRIKANTTSLACLQRPTPQRPSKSLYQGQPHILVGVSFSRDQPVGVVVMDIRSKKVVEYQSVRQLLSDRTVKARRGNRSITQLRLEKYRLVNRRHRQQQKNAIRRRQEQKQNRYAQSRSESNLGEYVDRLIASRIIKLALKWQASSIALPRIGDIRESIEAGVKARAKRKFPNELERQQNYAKEFRSSVHRWSYGRLINCIRSRASRVSIPVEQGQQPAQGTLQEQAAQVALSAYYTRQAPKS